jgi:hypothetical protein
VAIVASLCVLLAILAVLVSRRKKKTDEVRGTIAFVNPVYEIVELDTPVTRGRPASVNLRQRGVPHSGAPAVVYSIPMELSADEGYARFADPASLDNGYRSVEASVDAADVDPSDTNATAGTGYLEPAQGNIYAAYMEPTSGSMPAAPAAIALRARGAESGKSDMIYSIPMEVPAVSSTDAWYDEPLAEFSDGTVGNERYDQPLAASLSANYDVVDTMGRPSAAGVYDQAMPASYYAGISAAPDTQYAMFRDTESTYVPEGYDRPSDLSLDDQC